MNIQGQEDISLEQGKEEEGIITKNGDFITNIRQSDDQNILALIHQLPLVDIVHNQLFSSSLKIHLESNIYDVALIGGNKLIASNKNMPVRIFDISLGDNQNELQKQCGSLGSFNDKKQNSELFLTPMQIASNAQIIVGGGKKFLSKYDLNKISAQRFKNMDKKFISSVELLDKSCLVSGQFQGSISLIDLSSGEITCELKPHMDMVCRIRKVPGRDRQFVTLARKDNLCYLWDSRNMTTFVEYYEQERYGNQRTGMDISSNGESLYLGGQKGQIYVHKINNKKTHILQTGIKKCIGALSLTNKKLYCSLGQRSYPLFSSDSEKGHLISFSY